MECNSRRSSADGRWKSADHRGHSAAACWTGHRTRALPARSDSDVPLQFKLMYKEKKRADALTEWNGSVVTGHIRECSQQLVCPRSFPSRACMLFPQRQSLQCPVNLSPTPIAVVDCHGYSSHIQINWLWIGKANSIWTNQRLNRVLVKMQTVSFKISDLLQHLPCNSRTTVRCVFCIEALNSWSFSRIFMVDCIISFFLSLSRIEHCITCVNEEKGKGEWGNVGHSLQMTQLPSCSKRRPLTNPPNFDVFLLCTWPDHRLILLGFFFTFFKRFSGKYHHSMEIAIEGKYGKSNDDGTLNWERRFADWTRGETWRRQAESDKPVAREERRRVKSWHFACLNGRKTYTPS